MIPDAVAFHTFHLHLSIHESGLASPGPTAHLCVDGEDTALPRFPDVNMWMGRLGSGFHMPQVFIYRHCFLGNPCPGHLCLHSRGSPRRKGLSHLGEMILFPWILSYPFTWAYVPFLIATPFPHFPLQCPGGKGLLRKHAGSSSVQAETLITTKIPGG